MNDKEKMLILRESLEIIKKYADDPKYRELIERLNSQEPTDVNNILSDEMLMRFVDNQRDELADEYKKTSK